MDPTKFYDESTGWSSWRYGLNEYWHRDNEWQFDGGKQSWIWHADTNEVAKYINLFAPLMNTPESVDLLYGSTPTPGGVQHCEDDVDYSFIDDLI